MPKRKTSSKERIKRDTPAASASSTTSPRQGTPAAHDEKAASLSRSSKRDAAAKLAVRQELERKTFEQQRIVKEMIADDYREAHPGHEGNAPDGICHCGEPLFLGIRGIYKNENGDYYFDHMSCGSWACPVCSKKRDHLRQQEITAALLAAREAGHKALFLTFTMPHWSRDTCKKTRKTMQDAYTRLHRRSRFRRILREAGFLHQVRCWDFTHGDNGWHPHIHAIYFFDSDLDADELAALLCDEILDQWSAQVRTLTGRKVSKSHGFSCEAIHLMKTDEDSSAAAVAAYAAKRVSSAKVDEHDARSPFDFLVPRSSPAYERNKRIFVDYYKGQKGIRRVRMSPGMREAYSIEEATHPAPIQNKLADCHEHHMLFLSDIDHFHEFCRIAKEKGDAAALDWLDDQALAALAERVRLNASTSNDVVSKLLDVFPDRFRACRRDDVIAYLAGEGDEASALTYRQRARQLAARDANRVADLKRASDMRLDASLLESRLRVMRHLEALAFESSLLPDEARPLSGLSRVLLRIPNLPEARVLAPVESTDDFWF